MHVRVDRVVQVECSSENGAYDLPYVGIDKIESHIAGLSGGRAPTPRGGPRGRVGARRATRGVAAAVRGGGAAFFWGPPPASARPAPRGPTPPPPPPRGQ